MIAIEYLPSLLKIGIDVLLIKLSRYFRGSILPLLGLEEGSRSYRAPVIGDHVISHHQRWAFFGATIASFDREIMSYTVDWDDGDPTGKVQSYKVHLKNKWWIISVKPACFLKSHKISLDDNQTKVTVN